MNELALRVLDFTGSSSLITHIPYEQAYAPGFEDMQRRLPDIEKARAALNFQPRRTLEQILSDVVTDMGTRLGERAKLAISNQ
jgi:UDP-glucose 4-epimerase